MANAFDDLLASIPDTDRQVLSQVAERNPELKASVLRQADYSRKMDELSGKVKLAEGWDNWRKTAWVDNHYPDGKGATKKEIALEAELGQLKQKLEAGGDVTFEQLEQHIDKIAVARGYARQADIDTKAAGVEQYVRENLLGFAHVATMAPTLAIKHYQEFGETLDVPKLVEFAGKSEYQDLGKAYEEQVRERRAKLHEEAAEKAKTEAYERGKKEALAERGMSPTAMPVDGVDPDMGHFQRKVLGVDTAKEGVPGGEVSIGSGRLAALAAREATVGA